MTRIIDAAKAERLQLNEQIDELQTKIVDKKLSEKQSEREVATLRLELKTYKEPGEDAGWAAQFGDPKLWLWAAVGAVAGALVVIGVIVFRPQPDEDDAMFEDRDEKRQEVDQEDGKGSTDETNNDSGDQASH